MYASPVRPGIRVGRPFLERMRRFPRNRGVVRRAIQAVAACTIRAWLRVYHGYEIVGQENLPAAGSFVIVANHSSHLDALCLLSALPVARLHEAFPAAAADYFFQSLPRLALSVFVLNALPFDRSVHARESLAQCRKLLSDRGNILILFPEETRSTNGRVGEFRPGIALLLAGTAAPVVPCYLSGTRAALPKGAWMPRPRRIRLTIGAPLTLAAEALDRASLRHACEELRQAVLELGKDAQCPLARHSLQPAGSHSDHDAAPRREEPQNPVEAALAFASRGEHI